MSSFGSHMLIGNSNMILLLSRSRTIENVFSKFQSYVNFIYQYTIRETLSVQTSLALLKARQATFGSINAYSRLFKGHFKSFLDYIMTFFRSFHAIKLDIHDNELIKFGQSLTISV